MDSKTAISESFLFFHLQESYEKHSFTVHAVHRNWEPYEGQHLPVEETPKEYLWLIQTTSFLFRFLFRADHHQMVRLSVAAND